ncbi:MAG: alcohol dehydrogenase catalytic domain-containing protein [Pseudomonadota bacterium]
MKLNIAIIDDDADKADGIVERVKRMGSISFLGEACSLVPYSIMAKENDAGRLNVKDILTETLKTPPAVAIVDLCLQGDDDRSGVDLSLRIGALHSECRFILISSHFPTGREGWLYQFGHRVDRIACDFEARFREAVETTGLAHLSRTFNTRYRSGHFQTVVNDGCDTMWGLVLQGGGCGVTLREDLPLPLLDANTVVVETIAIGVCGTDLGAFGQRNNKPYDVIEFHEALGRVVWAGEAVRTLAVGDFVVPMVRRCQPWDTPPDKSAVDASSFRFHDCDESRRADCYHSSDACPTGPYSGSPTQEGRRVGYQSRGTGRCHGFGSQYFVDREEWLVKIDQSPECLYKRGRGALYVLAEPLSIACKMRREVLRHTSIRVRTDRVLIIGLGPIGLLCAMLLSELHPGLSITAVDLADDNNERVRQLTSFYKDIRFVQAQHEGKRPAGLAEAERFQLIIEATPEPHEVFKYAPALLSPRGTLVMLGLSEKDLKADISSGVISDLVRQGKLLLGSVNSSRADFEDAITFMERSVRVRTSDLLEAMVVRWPIDKDLPDRLIQVLGNTAPKDRNEIKVVLEAWEYTEQCRKRRSSSV